MRNNRFASVFSLCHNCGEPCLAQNYYCEDCANELFDVECDKNEQLIEENKILAKALELACKQVEYVPLEDDFLSIGLFGENVGEIVAYFKQKAEKEMSNG